MSKKQGLGRGLGALIPQTPKTPPAGSAGGPIFIPVERVHPNPNQPRQFMDDEKLEELADSIREHGIIQPIMVTMVDNKYQIVAGERRWRASQRAGLTEVPVFIKEMTSQQMLEMAIVENIQRADLKPLEEAQAYAQLMEEFGLTQEVVAKKVGKSRTAVANTLRLLKLTDELKIALSTDKITEGHARALLSITKPRAQADALNTVVTRKLNVRQTEALVRQIMRGDEKPKSRRTHLSTQDKDMVSRFQERLGTKVEMRRDETGKQGSITIHFYSEEELQSVFEKFLPNDKGL